MVSFIKQGPSWRFPVAAALCLMAATPQLRAGKGDVHVFPPDAIIRSGEVYTFKAGVASAQQPLFHWTLEAPAGEGDIQGDAEGNGAFRAPFVLRKTEFTVRAAVSTCASSFGLATFWVHPPQYLELMEKIGFLTGEAAAPRAECFVGEYPETMNSLPLEKPFPWGPTCGFRSEDGRADAAQIASAVALVHAGRCGNPDLDRRWLFVDQLHQELRTVSQDGDVRTWARFKGHSRGNQQSVTADAVYHPLLHHMALAVRPAGKEGKHLWQCVLAHPSWNYVLLIDEDKKMTEMGKGEIGDAHGLAMDGEGNIYVAAGKDLGSRIVRISPKGAVTPLAGVDGPEVDIEGTVFVDARGTICIAMAEGGIQRHYRDGRKTFQAGPGSKEMTAPFQELGGMTRDDQTGDLYVINGHAIQRVSAKGEVTPVLGHPRQAGFEARGKAASGAVAQPLADGPCLYSPQAVKYFRGCLYIVDRGNHAIRVFDLKTRQLSTLAGDPGQATRMGPLRNGAADFTPARCAGLFSPLDIALDEDGACCVTLGRQIIQLCLPGPSGSEVPRPDPGDAKLERKGS